MHYNKSNILSWLIPATLLILCCSIQLKSTPKSAEERQQWATQVYQNGISKKDTSQIAEAYYLFGKNEMILSQDYFKAKMWFLKSLELLEKLPPSSALVRINLRLAQTDLYLFYYRNAYNYLQNAKKYAEIIQSSEDMSNAYVSLSGFFDILSNTRNNSHQRNPFINADSSKYYLIKAEKYAKKEYTAINHQITLLKGISNTETLEKHISNFGPYEAQSTIKTTSLLLLSQMYSKENNPTKAFEIIKLAEEAYSQISQHQNVEIQLKQAYIDYYVAMKMFAEAFAMEKELQAHERKNLIASRNDEFNDLEDGDKLAETKITKQLLQTELDLRLALEKSRTRQIYITLLIILFLLSIAVFMYHLSRKNAKISEQNKLLVKEQQHRFNNNLQVVSNLLSIKSRDRKDVDVLLESQMLIQSIALLQRKLYAGSKLAHVNLQEILPDLVNSALQAMRYQEIKLTLEIEEIIVNPEEALSINLILTELITNSCKYAFSEIHNPSLLLLVKKMQNNLFLEYKDNGKNAWSMDDTKSDSFGRILITHLVKTLNGNYKFHYQNGTVFSFNFKLSPI
jgi:two-component sensor histidine kinase